MTLEHMTNLTIPAVVRAAAKQYGRNEALVDDDRALTYGDLEQEVERVARALIASGVEPGDRVSIWGPNSIDWALLCLGVYAAGAVLVPLNTRFKGDEAGHVLRAAQVRMLFTSTDFLGIDYVELIGRMGGVDYLDEVIALPGRPREATTSWDEFLARSERVVPSAVAAREAALREGDTSDIVFTSGTTGAPKGAMLTHGASVRTYLTWTDGIGLNERDRFLVVFPFFQTSGLKAGILACALRGAANVPQAVFDVPTVARRISEHRITVLPGAPTVFQAMLDSSGDGGVDLGTLRVAVTGGATTPVEVIRRMRDELGLETIVTAYGLTETTGTVSMCRHGDPVDLVANSVGRPIPQVEVRIVDADGNTLGPGEPGEVLVRGFNVMRGYFNAPEATAEAVDADGWLRTGDIGVLDDDQVLRITDRKKDMYIAGGFNVYPAEVENLMLQHPDVAQVAVVGMPDDRLGEVGAAFLVAKPDREIDDEAFVAWCRERMANYKVPRRVEALSELPLNPNGKVLKCRLRERL